jgi:hypothetical protein
VPALACTPGATDVSEQWGELTLTDARGVQVFRSPGLDARRYLSPDAPALNPVVRLAGGNPGRNRWVFSFQDVVVPVDDLVEVEATLDAPSPRPAVPVAPTAAPSPFPDMASVPGGTYRIGADPRLDPDATLDEFPAHGGTPRRLQVSTDAMENRHAFSPDGRWPGRTRECTRPAR